MQLFTNNADSVLNGAIAADTTAITLSTGDGSKFPLPTGGDFFLATLFQKAGASEINHEIVKCVARAGDVLTVVRAQEGTTAREFNTGDGFELRVTAGTLANKEDLSVVGTTDQYWRGDKSWSDLGTDVRAVVQTGLTAGTVTAPWSSVSDKPAVIAAGATAADARTAIGAGTSNLVIGTTAGTALAGDTAFQTPLVSGTSIKTVNSTSLLGSGNIAVQTPLVSGTSIKTINSTSLLGSGNVVTGDVTTTGPQTLTNKALTTPLITGTREVCVAMPANAIDLATGNLFTKTISGVTTLTVSNVPTTGDAASFILELTNAGSAAITWFSGVKWAGGTAPTLTTTGVDVLGFYSHDGGTTWRGMLLSKDSK